MRCESKWFEKTRCTVLAITFSANSRETRFVHHHRLRTSSAHFELAAGRRRAHYHSSAHPRRCAWTADISACVRPCIPVGVFCAVQVIGRMCNPDASSSRQEAARANDSMQSDVHTETQSPADTPSPRLSAQKFTATRSVRDERWVEVSFLLEGFLR